MKKQLLEFIPLLGVIFMFLHIERDKQTGVFHISGASLIYHSWGLGFLIGMFITYLLK